MIGFREFLALEQRFNTIEYKRRYLGEPVLDLSHLTDSHVSQIYDITMKGRKLKEVAGYWGAYDLAAKYTTDTPGQKNHLKLLNRLLKAKRMRKTE